MAKKQGIKPDIAGGRTLAKARKGSRTPSSSNRKGRKATWAENGGVKYSIQTLTKGRIREHGTTPDHPVRRDVESKS